MSIRILIADDQSLVRTGFRMILDAEPDLDVVGEAVDGREAVDKAKAAKPKTVEPKAVEPKTVEPRATAAIGHGTSPYAVQVGASPSEEDAKALLARVEKKFGADVSGLKTDVVAATVDGKQVYRALISGFAGASDANALCSRLKAGGQACFVRK